MLLRFASGYIHNFFIITCVCLNMREMLHSGVPAEIPKTFFCVSKLLKRSPRVSLLSPSLAVWLSRSVLLSSSILYSFLSFLVCVFRSLSSLCWDAFEDLSLSLLIHLTPFLRLSSLARCEKNIRLFLFSVFNNPVLEFLHKFHTHFCLRFTLHYILRTYLVAVCSSCNLSLALHLENICILFGSET